MPDLQAVTVLIHNLDATDVTSEVTTGDLFPGDGEAYKVVAARLRVRSVDPELSVVVDFYGTLQERRDLVARLAEQVGMTATVLGVVDDVPPHPRHALSPEVATALDGKPCAHCVAEGRPCWVHER